MPNIPQIDAEFSDLRSAQKALVYGLPDLPLLSDRIPIFCERFSLSLSDFQKHDGPSRDSLEFWKSGNKAPQKSSLDMLWRAAKKVLVSLKFEAAIAALAADWLIRGSPTNKEAPKRTEQKPENLPKPSQAESSPSDNPLPPYTDEEYAEIKAKKLWGQIDPARLVGRGTVLLMGRHGASAVAEPLDYLPDGQVSEALQSGRRVVCRAIRDVCVEDVMIGEGLLFTIGLTNWSELFLSDPAFREHVERVKSPSLAQAIEAERLVISPCRSKLTSS